jgi:tRNA pseudouridine38-40 synthase
MCAAHDDDRPLYNGLEVGAAMTLWKIVISYDGSGMHGWQVQPGQPTVQGTLAAALEKMTGERVLPQGSGRTDAGVHALGQVASFALKAEIPAENLLRALNGLLPQSVRVLKAEEVGWNFHARHSAVRKSYEYRIFERKVEEQEEENICPPFVAPYAWDCRWVLELEPMKLAAAMLCGTHDFTSFAAADPDRAQREEGGAGPNPVKTIITSEMAREDGLLRYRVTGSGFLHHMVRNLVGTLVEVGRGALQAEEVQKILAAKDRTAAGPTAPAQGLFLVDVHYDRGKPVRV